MQSLGPEPDGKHVGTCWIEASQCSDGLQEGCLVSGKGGSEPEADPGFGILRADTDGLTVGFNGGIVFPGGFPPDPFAVAGDGMLRSLW